MATDRIEQALGAAGRRLRDLLTQLKDLVRRPPVPVPVPVRVDGRRRPER